MAHFNVKVQSYHLRSTSYFAVRAWYPMEEVTRPDKARARIEVGDFGGGEDGLREEESRMSRWREVEFPSKMRRFIVIKGVLRAIGHESDHTESR